MIESIVFGGNFTDAVYGALIASIAALFGFWLMAMVARYRGGEVTESDRQFKGMMWVLVAAAVVCLIIGPHVGLLVLGGSLIWNLLLANRSARELLNEILGR